MDCWKTKEIVTKSVGIAGSIRGSGATHLSVALANYAASGLGQKTAYLELDGHGEIAHWKETNKQGYFTVNGVHYYPNVKRDQIPILLNYDYEWIFMDFGDEYRLFREDLLRCDRKIFLLNLNPWQEFYAKEMLRAVLQKNWGGIQPVYAGVKMQYEEKKRMEREFGIMVTQIPLILNPNCVMAEQFSFFDAMLGRFAAGRKRKRSLIPKRRR